MYKLDNMFLFFQNKMSLRNFKLRTQMVITYSLLIFILVVGLSAFSYVNSKNIITKNSTLYTLGILEQIRNNIDINLEQIDKLSYLIFSNKSVQHLLKSNLSYNSESVILERINVENIMTDVMFSRNDIDSVIIYDMHGNKITTNPTAKVIPLNELYNEADLNKGKFVWLSTDLKSSVIPIIRTIRDMNMRVIGILQINIRERSIREIFSKEVEKMKGQVYLINDKGVIISCLNQALIGKNFKTEALLKMNNAVKYTIEDYDGKLSIITRYSSNVNNWKYIGVVPISQISKDSLQFGKMIFLAGLFAILIFIFVSIVLAWRIVKPLQQIAKNMKEVNIENWKPQIVYKGKDEIAYLSKSFNDMILKINSLIGEVVIQKELQSKSELLALQAQINPHFLYNTLEIVNWTAKAKGAPEICDIVKALSDMMRYVLNCNDLVTIEEEMNHVKNYCFIQKKRYGEKLYLEFAVDDEILDFKIPKLSIQPLVENVFAHGFKGLNRKGQIRVDGVIDSGRIKIHVIDNGVGITPEKLNKIGQLLKDRNHDEHTGVGIYIVSRRIKLVYKGKYGVNVESVLGKGTTFTINLPLED